MRTSLNPLMYQEFSYSRLFESAGTYELELSPGTYYVGLCGGGGAGGTGAQMGLEHRQGAGGAGGTAVPTAHTITIIKSVRATVYVGAGGLTYANGGNGGAGGDTTDSGSAGRGGGGGHPTYINIPTQEIQLDLYAWRNSSPFGGIFTPSDTVWTQSSSPRIGDTVYGCDDLLRASAIGFMGYVRGKVSAVSETAITYKGTEFIRMGGWDGNGYVRFDGTFLKSDGGGGGGGGGGPGHQGRYSDGGSGGGGGGYYRIENGVVVSVPGKKGGKGGVALS